MGLTPGAILYPFGPGVQSPPRRRQAGGGSVLADLEAREPSDLDVLAHLGDELGDEVADLELVVADVGLVEEADLFEELAQLAQDDLLHDLRRLLHVAELGQDDLLFLGHDVGRDVGRGDPARLGRGDLQADLLDQLLELAVAGDEIGLAIELDEDADAAVHMDVGADQAFLGGPAGLGLGPGVALLAQELDGLVHVAVALGQGGLAFHHADAGALAQLFDFISGDFHGLPLDAQVSSGISPSGVSPSAGAAAASAAFSSRSSLLIRFFLPSMIDSAAFEANSSMARTASSLPGMG